MRRALALLHAADVLQRASNVDLCADKIVAKKLEHNIDVACQANNRPKRQYTRRLQLFDHNLLPRSLDDASLRNSTNSSGLTLPPVTITTMLRPAVSGTLP